MPRSRSRSKSRSKSRHRESGPSSALASQLRSDGMTPASYLAKARSAARRTGYPAQRLQFSDDAIHKLRIENPDGQIRRFGRVGYGDFIIWSHLERTGHVDRGYAAQKQYVFRTSHGALSKKRGITDPYAPNNLAINILW